MNKTIMQFFEWHISEDGTLWNYLKTQCPSLSKLGINILWLPPAYKGAFGSSDVGYDPYDLYDLGEFNQKGSIMTKYGTKDEYISAINEAHKNKIEILADIVLDHKNGADDTEWVKAVKVNPSNRNLKQSNEYNIKAWTKFIFAARKGKYSDFNWNWENFDGVDFDENNKEKAIFEFTGECKSFDNEVDSENGNYDYLMCADIDVSTPSTYKELIKWGLWYTSFANLDGFRLDAVKHIEYDFYNKWLSKLRKTSGKELFTVGEYWSTDVENLKKYLQNTSFKMSLFDVPLHNKFYKASKERDNFDLRGLLSDCLVNYFPENTVTFVDNHDTQPGQSLEAWVDNPFKMQAYTFILTRQEGIPCIFFGDYYGIITKDIKPLNHALDKLIKIRSTKAYGNQHDYFQNAHTVGWTREKGLAAVISNADAGTIKMFVGKGFAGKNFIDITENICSEVIIDEDGSGDFSVQANSYSVWCVGRDTLPYVKVKFIVNNVDIKSGENIYISGSTKELGRWDVEKSIRFYPSNKICTIVECSIELPVIKDIEFKLIKKVGKVIKWELSNNRIITPSKEFNEYRIETLNFD